MRATTDDSRVSLDEDTLRADRRTPPADAQDAPLADDLCDADPADAAALTESAPEAAVSEPAPLPRPAIREVLNSWRVRPTLRVPDDQAPYFFCLLIASVVLAAALFIALIAGSSAFFRKSAPTPPAPPSGDSTGIPSEGSHPFADGAAGTALIPFPASPTVINKNQLSAHSACLVDVSEGKVTASYHGDEVIFPASMTKIMTLIIVAENLPEESNLKDVITVSQSVYDAMVAAGSSGVHLDAGEQVTVEGLIYMLMLRSDGIAANELARYIAGSESAFVTLMNMKAADMGLKNTHFTNTTGLYDPNHVSSCRDMASILAYAMNMSFCKKILTTESFTVMTHCTQGDNAGKNPTYYLYHNLLVSMLGETYRSYRPARLTVVAGKTGYSGRESGYCLATYATDPDGHAYICVTAKSASYLDCIKDYITIYDNYAK